MLDKMDMVDNMNMVCSKYAEDLLFLDVASWHFKMVMVDFEYMADMVDMIDIVDNINTLGQYRCCE